MKNEKSPRKPLRQRVADRQRGIKEIIPMSGRKKRVVRFLKMFLTASQYTGLLLLLLSLGGIVTSGYEVDNWNLVMVYSSMFIVGRAGITIMNSISSLRQ
ncbi:MAG: hypothetical protein P8I94_00455 [Emcibacteraceae bacterium]|nr:hypothetical protein [Emcibacteraceae bacterium]